MNRLEYPLDRDHKWSKLKLVSEPAFLVVVPFNDGYEEVITNDATNIGTNKATLNGTLVQGGAPFSGYCWFDYGETTDYGYSTASQYVEDGAPFSEQVTGLKPNTLYHFRAATGGETAYGEDKTFRTKGGGGMSLLFETEERRRNMGNKKGE